MHLDPLNAPRPDDVLGNLPQHKQDFIISLFGQMSRRAIIRQLALPEPEGLGLKVHLASLQRFYTRALHRHILRENEDLISKLQPVAESIKAAPNPYPGVTRVLLEQHLLGLALDPHGSEAKLARISNLLLRTRALDLRERQIRIKEDPDREKNLREVIATTLREWEAKCDEVDRLRARLQEYSRPAEHPSQSPSDPLSRGL